MHREPVPERAPPAAPRGAQPLLAKPKAARSARGVGWCRPQHVRQRVLRVFYKLPQRTIDAYTRLLTLWQGRPASRAPVLRPVLCGSSALSIETAALLAGPGGQSRCACSAARISALGACVSTVSRRRLSRSSPSSGGGGGGGDGTAGVEVAGADAHPDVHAGGGGVAGAPPCRCGGGDRYPSRSACS